MFIKKYIRLFTSRHIEDIEEQIDNMVDEGGAEIINQSISSILENGRVLYVVSVTFIFHDNLD